MIGERRIVVIDPATGIVISDDTLDGTYLLICTGAWSLDDFKISDDGDTHTLTVTKERS